MTTNRTSYVYVGLAGETAPGRPVKSGLYRMAVGDDRWELVIRGLPEAPAIRAIATHPEHPGTVYVGTQHGPHRSTDHGEHWERLNISDHGLPVWSLLFDPGDCKVLYAGYENCEIFRSDDGGERWQQLRVSVRFPEVTVAPGANPAKRVLELAVNPADPNEIYGAVEVGGVIRSLDGGEHWENMSHGQYVNDDTVDMHGVLVHGVVVHVLPMTHVLPVLAAVEATDDTSDFDGAVDLIGIGWINGQLQDPFGRVGPGGHGHFREADAHPELLPALAAVVTSKDLAVLVTRVQHLAVARIEQQRPNRQAVIRDVESFPVLPVVRAAVGT